MWKKVSLGGFALLLVLLANTHMACRVSINGVTAEGSFSPWAHDNGLLAAAAASEEILEDRSSLPRLSTSFTLSLRPPAGSAAELSDAVLRSTGGIELLDGVFVNSVPLGKVENGETLMEKLRGFLYNTMPTGAVKGSYSEEVAIRPIYARAGTVTDYEDMVLLVSGMAPAVYIDAQGNRVMG